MKEREFLCGDMQEIADFCDSHSEEYDRISDHLVLYLCVCLTGYFEQFVKEIIGLEEDEKKRYSNFGPKMLKGYLGKCSREWQRALEEAFANDDEIEHLLDAMVKERHKIAHGESTYMGIKVLKSYVENVCTLEKIISNIVEKHPLH